MRNIDLLDVHHELSCIVHAIKLELDPIRCDVKMEWREGTYLCALVEVHKRDKQVVIDRLSRGAIHDVYDYRFHLSYSTYDDTDWQEICAYVDLSHKSKNAA